MRTPHVPAFVLAALLALGLPAEAPAHEPGLSVLDIRVTPAGLEIELALAAGDADEAARRHAEGRVETFARDAVRLALDGQPVALQVEAVATDDQGVRVALSAGHPGGAVLSVDSDVARRLPRGHRQLLTVRAADGDVLAERLVDAEDAPVLIALDSPPAPGGGAGGFFRLGIAHILEGYDHLLFLAALLVVARRAMDVLKTVTAFTVAHSLTLALATTGVVQAPAHLVEPFIAASIVYVGLENLVRRQVGSRGALTFAFGLIHGFGFAGALRELGVADGGAGLLVPLASFNLGVEAGQVAVAAALLPVLWLLRARPAIGAPVAALGSAAVAVAGSYWLVERTLAAAG